MVKESMQLREINQPIYRYRQALYHSFFNHKLYVDVGKRWKGFGFTYFLLLIAIVTIPFAVRAGLALNRYINDTLEPFEKLPIIYVQNGMASIDEPMPYVIKNKKNQTIAIVDTTGSIPTISSAYPYLNVLITKDRAFMRLPPQHVFYNPTKPVSANPVKEYPLKEIDNAVFEGKDWVNQFGLKSIRLLLFLIYPLLTMFSFTFFAIFLSAFALMGQLITQLLHFSISYKQSCRLTMVSVTPFMVLFWCLLTFGWASSTFNFLLFPLFIIYFCFAVLSLKRYSQKLVIL